MACIRNARRKLPRFQVNKLDIDHFYNIKDISAKLNKLSDWYTQRKDRVAEDQKNQNK